ncbi:toprim domain-containing protein [Tenacibaculum discolor]|uniref:toprim domain-containing protein n=1 Tax=Tenacibaculum discolor TaxID=361581 RepID=UPI000F2028CC|nr:toprim domain-containing protein [Tenacibaculum discolor]RLK06709.1 Toprim domain-containing protein [Tenacibaculum discolor]
MKREKFNCQKAKKMNVLSIARKLNLKQSKQKGSEVWFFYGNEKTASLKVDISKNVWYNFSQGIGGNTLDLVVHIFNCSVSEALGHLNILNGSFSFHQQVNDRETRKEEVNYIIKRVQPLNHVALLDYLSSRKVDLDIAKKYCKEIYYSLNDKNYFAIAFVNDSKGYAIRNKFFKGCLLKQDISTIKNASSRVCLFEGFINFLSYLTIYKNETLNDDFIVLNSTSLVDKAIGELKEYSDVYCYFDNDDSGKKAMELISKVHEKVMDCSEFYKGFNDLNEYLTSIKNERH